MLQKVPVDISFAKGLDQKTDPKRVQVGKFLGLYNTIFDKIGRLTKRNGFGTLAALPDATSIYLTTFNNSLLAIGNTLESYNGNTDTWVNKGTLQPCSLNVMSLIKSNTGQTQADSVVADNGLVCVAYTDQNPANLSQTIYKYAIFDSVTGECIVNPTTIQTNVANGTPRVFLLSTYFVIVFTTAANHLQFITISSTNPSIVTAAADIATSVVSASTVNFDGVVANSSLYIAYNTTSGGQSIKVSYISSSLNVVTPVTYAGEIATLMSVTADNTTPSNPIIYVSYYDLPTTTGKTLVVDKNLNPILAPTTTIPSGTILNLTSTAVNGTATLYYEVSEAYSYDSNISTNYIESITCTSAGVVGTAGIVIRSVGLASKAFTIDSVDYILSIYYSANASTGLKSQQPTYFLINSSGKIISKLAYANGPGYYETGLPIVTVSGTKAYIPYLRTNLLLPTSKVQGAATFAAFYSQSGVSLASFELDPDTITASEIGTNINISGGFVAAYDGFSAVEQEFFVWPEFIKATWSATGGSMEAQPDGATNTNAYFYQVTYEWTDNQGNIFRSAPSIPVSLTTTGNGVAGSVALNIPTLRLTYKTATPVKIVVYRWSVGQQVYHQTTSITTPVLNSTTVDSVTFTDTNSDDSIAGTNIIYTAGGVIENLSPPASDNLTLFNNRLWLVNAEDRNELWFSKQVIQATPVEMSDLLTLYVAPSTASQGSTGPITAIAPMDDKLIVFKESALGYISGIGPDNTGNNNQYSDFTLINSTVGCINQSSIVFMPNGLMFQSNKGIWLLGRDLSTVYIGAAVDNYNSDMVTSAVTVPGTNQVRFTMASGVALMYDYFVGEWAVFNNVAAVSSTIFNDLHTYITSSGRARIETPGSYLDDTSPVLLGFTTSWIALAGIQGYERFYFAYLLGEYITPFKLNVQMAYDFNTSNQSATIVVPEAPTGSYGDDPLYGSSTPFGGHSSVFDARIFPTIQKCESFQLTVTEIYDPQYGIAPGAGLTLSGLNLIAGVKKAYRTQSAGRSFG